MKSCSGYQEKLLMDIHGELESEFQSDWEKHMEKCADCSRERENLHKFIKKIQDAAPCPELPPEEERAMTRSIMNELRKDQESVWRRWLEYPFEKRIPALLSACIILIIFGWFGIQDQNADSPVKTASNLNIEKSIIKDFDVINNLELLEEMEALEKLVNVVDQQEYGVILNHRILAQKEMDARNEKYV